MTARSFTDVEYNYKKINEDIAEAAQKVGKKREDITFLAATKTVDAATMYRSCSQNTRTTILTTVRCSSSVICRQTRFGRSSARSI